MITFVVLGLLLLPFLIIGGGLALFWKRKRRTVLRWSGISYLIAAAALLFGVGPYLMSWAIVHSGTRPPDRLLKENPGTFGAVYEDVVFEARDGVRLSGWFMPPTTRNVVLICTHGLFRNRMEVLPRIIPLARAGDGALLYDSRSHGASQKAAVTLGFAERNDVLGAMDYIRRRFQDSVDQPKIVLMGISMGAVSTLEAAAEGKGYSAIILDSPFLSLRDAVVRHSWLFLKLPRFPFPSLFLFSFQMLTGVDPDRVNSLNALKRAEPVPILIIASEGDERIGASPARELYEAARSPRKKLRVFGADVPHGAAARLHPEAYNSALLEFLSGI